MPNTTQLTRLKEVYKRLPMRRKKFFFGFLISLVIICSSGFTVDVFANENATVFTLSQTINGAIKANLALQSSLAGKKAAQAQKNVQRSNFLPSFNATYQYSRDDEASQIGGITTGAEKEYSFVTTVTQPIFAGFYYLNRYRVARLGLNVAEIDEKLVRREIIFNAQKIYFSLLKAQKLFDIATNTVTQLKAHKEVARNYYQVGMTPLNDFLQADVELANAEQDLIRARNQMENAESDFNNLLRRPLHTPVKIEDIVEYLPFEQELEYCLSEAEKNRLEIKVAELEVEIAEKETDLAKKNYYPSIDLKGSYFKNGASWDVDGGDGISDPSGWNVLATATWDFWQWGKTAYGHRESKERLNQARLKKEEVLDNIHLQVKNAYLQTQEAEKAILTVEKAIEQAKENFRINQERYKEQIASSTDVLDAQTLLSKTTSNYYNALYEFKISKAALYKAMGQEIIE